MVQIRKTLFISDLHLEEAHPETCQQFLQFLQNCGSDVDTIYILGDLFETWIGDDNDTPFHRKIIQALKETSEKGVSIHFLRGNRDFLIGKKFLRAAGCHRLTDEHKISLYGTPVLLMHGDTLCTQDVAYLRARRILRNRFLLKLFLLLVPLKSRQNFADGLRVKSKRYTQSATKQIMDVTPDEVLRVMKKHGVNVLVHGHTHRPAVHELVINNEKAERIVLGAWHTNGHALVWDSTGKKELVEF